MRLLEFISKRTFNEQGLHCFVYFKDTRDGACWKTPWPLWEQYRTWPEGEREEVLADRLLLQSEKESLKDAVRREGTGEVEW